MKLTLDIDMNDNKALALINYIRTLEFIRIKEEDREGLTDEQKSVINEGIEQLKYGNSSSHDNVINETKERYPNFF